MTKLVTIFGGSGFLGRYIAQRMARIGWRVRVAVRRPNEAMFVKPYGSVGQVAPLLCNIRNDESVFAATIGADAIVNCVGILVEQGRNGFDAVLSEGAARIARIATETGVARLVHVSAIGADPNSASKYSQSKAVGETRVLEQFPRAIILRPAVMFGTEDRFFNKFAAMTRLGPVLAIVGGDSKMQPVFVDDVAQAAVAGVIGRAKPGVYELGGPDVRSLRELNLQMLAIIERRRLVVNLPFWAGGAIGAVLDGVQKLSLGLVVNSVLTRDQVKSLRNNSTVSDWAKGLAHLGIMPTAMETVLPKYLWPYRPSGQYAAIKASAKNLKV